MAKFQFRLATLLRLREAVRDERRGQLAEACQWADLVQGRLDAVRRALDEWKRNRAVPAGAVDVSRLLEADRYETVLRSDERHVEQERAAVAAQIEKRREALVAASRDVRALETVRDAETRRHQAEAQRRLAKELDADVSARAHSTRGGS